MKWIEVTRDNLDCLIAGSTYLRYYSPVKQTYRYGLFTRTVPNRSTLVVNSDWGRVGDDPLVCIYAYWRNNMDSKALSGERDGYVTLEDGYNIEYLRDRKFLVFKRGEG